MNHRSGLRANAALVAGVAALALVLWLLLGPGTAGYDAAWSLVWGDQAAHGHLPSFEAVYAPTPHPLANLVATVLAPLSDGAAQGVLVALYWLSLAALGIGAGALGTALFALPVGVLAAVVVLSRGLLVGETAQGIVDIPFLALVVWAAVAEARRPRAGAAAPVLLALGGLLRPEGWLVAGVYALYRGLGPRLLACVVVPPLLWIAMDLIVTGDPLHSLHGTRDLAIALGRPRSTGTAFAAAPVYLRAALEEPVVWVAFAGAAAALVGAYEAALLPGAVVVLGLVAFLVLGVAGLPLLIRYLLLPAVMLALFCAVAALGWTGVARDAPAWRWWAAGGALALIVLVAGAPGDVRRLERVRTHARGYHGMVEDLQAIAGEPAVRAAAERCGTVQFPDGRPVPTAVLAFDRPPGVVRGTDRGGPALVLTYRRIADAERYALDPGGATVAPNGPRVAANRTWLATARGCPTS